MDVKSFAWAVLVAVVSGLILDTIKRAKEKAHNAAQWKKDVAVFCLCLIACITFEALLICNWGKSAIVSAVLIIGVAISAGGLLALFWSFRRALASVYDLAAKAFDYSEQSHSSKVTEESAEENIG